ncbi:MAG: S-methyl-5-thioribose-1-phosphate isomerase [Anaerolineales bacterium]|nr:S-methyl-5-thioribose-1-phosphate isomerase [Anaerolineales bacterium]
MRTVAWDETRPQVRMIDQRSLPGELKVHTCEDHLQVAAAIRDMVVRGAPAIGVAAAFGMALAALKSPAADVESLRTSLREAAALLQATRPTAVNLSWALQRVLGWVDQPQENPAGLRSGVLRLALEMAEEDVAANRRMAEFGAALIADGDTLLHHCNTGALAAVDWGTALGAIRMAHEQGKRLHVLVDETRPRLQGARLTAWELEQYGIPYEVICDGAAGFFLQRGQVDKVFFGADRVAANGDVVNKVGTYMLALAAHAQGVPVYAVAPTSTIDVRTASGAQAPIEERDPMEVLDLQVSGGRVFPAGARARNPAFDVTPHRLLAAIVTEKGVVHPPFAPNLENLAAPAG